MLRPRVARCGSEGIHISLLNTTSDFNSDCDLLNIAESSPRSACQLAAARLRQMADALDIIAESDKPFHEETAIAAVREAGTRQPTKSRSVLRREAAQRGEEPPEFSSGREGK